MNTPTGDGPAVLRTDRGKVATLTLNRPRSRNALSMEMLAALDEALAGISADRSVNVVVVAGNGPAFSAGHDLKELLGSEDEDSRRNVFSTCSAVMVRLATMPQATIAKVGGVATAAGCQLVATCDLAVAAESARFATPGVDIGLFCSTPAVAVARTVPSKFAMQLLLTGDLVPAADALRMALVNDVVPDEKLDEAVDDLAERIAAKPPSVIAAGKRTYREQVGLPLVDAYGVASEAMVEGLARPEAAEGIGAFLEKRRPNWQS